MIFVVIVAYILIAYFQTSSLKKKKYRRELIVFYAFWLVAFVLSILYILDVNIPSPAKFIQYVIEDILKLKYES